MLMSTAGALQTSPVCTDKSYLNLARPLVLGQALQHSVGEPVQAHVQSITKYGAFLAFDVEAESGAVSTVYGLMQKRSAGPGGVQALLVSTSNPSTHLAIWSVLEMAWGVGRGACAAHSSATAAAHPVLGWCQRLGATSEVLAMPKAEAHPCGFEMAYVHCACLARRASW